jgi:uncharacterized protein
MRTVGKPSPWNPDRLDVLSMARERGEVEGTDDLGRYERLASLGAEGAVHGEVGWRARAELRGGEHAVPPAAWLHLQVHTTLPMTCQRCLQPVPVPLAVDRWFRFVADEATAEVEDEHSEEDVLALDPLPDLRALVEDELLMALPPIPMHDACPRPLLPTAGAASLGGGEDDQRPHPFAVLARLKR